MFFSSSMTIARSAAVLSVAVMGSFCDREAPVSSRKANDPRLYVAAAVIVAGSGVLGHLVFGRTGLPDVVMLFLLGVVVASLRLGRGPSLFAAVLSVLTFDYFFIPPYYSFRIVDLRHVVTFAVMLIVATVISRLTTREREHSASAEERERRTTVLYHLSRDLARARSDDAVVLAAARHIEEVLGSRVSILVPKGANLEPMYESANLAPIAAAERGVAQSAWTTRLQAGLGTPTFAESNGLYLPLVASRGAIGVMGLFPDDPHRFDDPAQRYFLDAFASQVAATIERAELAEEAEERRMQIDTEKLRNALLSSVSHDLRTPLAVITGAASTLLDERHDLPAPSRRDLLKSIYAESERLNRLIGNLLDMTRLESGAVTVKKEWYPVQEIIGAALNRMEQRLSPREVKVSAAPDMMGSFDGVLVEQALVNLLENAAKYTSPEVPVDVTARVDGTDLVLSVADRGQGFAPGEEERIFEKFYRGQRDGGAGGAGIGLTVARGIAVAHGGRLAARNREGGGAIFTMVLPIEGTPPEAPEQV